jgi:hypothetical protein
MRYPYTATGFFILSAGYLSGVLGCYFIVTLGLESGLLVALFVILGALYAIITEFWFIGFARAKLKSIRQEARQP